MDSLYFKYKSKIISLGFSLLFDHTNDVFYNKQYKKYICCFSEGGYLLTDFYYLSRVFKKLSRYLFKFIKKEALVLFISLNKDFFYMRRIYKTIQQRIYSYFIYDWIFGAVSNYKRIFKTYVGREQDVLNRYPDIAILMHTEQWTWEIIGELQARHVFCIGVTKPIYIKFMDYPLPLVSTFESGFLLIRYLMLVFKNNIMERVFYYMTKRYVEEYKKTISS
jgi:hypothetical protein